MVLGLVTNAQIGHEQIKEFEARTINLWSSVLHYNAFFWRVSESSLSCLALHLCCYVADCCSISTIPYLQHLQLGKKLRIIEVLHIQHKFPASTGANKKKNTSLFPGQSQCHLIFGHWHLWRTLQGSSLRGEIFAHKSESLVEYTKPTTHTHTTVISNHNVMIRILSL